MKVDVYETVILQHGHVNWKLSPPDYVDLMIITFIKQTVSLHIKSLILVVVDNWASILIVISKAIN